MFEVVITDTSNHACIDQLDRVNSLDEIAMNRTMKIALRLSAVFAIAILIRDLNLARVSCHGETHVYTYSPWVPACIVLGGLAFSLWMYRTYDLWEFYSNLFTRAHILGPLGAAIVFMAFVATAATAFLGVRVQVDENSVIARGSIWENLRSEDDVSVRFVDVERLDKITVREWRGGRHTKGWYTYEYLVFECKGGDKIRMCVNNDVSRMALSQILKVAARRDIPASDGLLHIGRKRSFRNL